MGKRYQCADGGQDVFADTASSQRVSRGEKFLDVGDVLRCLRMKDKALVFTH
jgi:hypothetical protein